MNHIYRLVWSRVANSWVAVAENARGKGKTKSRTGKLAVKLTAAALSVSAISFSLSSPAYAANANDASIAAGNGSAGIATVGTTTTINQTSQRVAIDWTRLSTAANEALVFNQPNAAAIALNRITGSSPSTLLGSLTANGQVYILNPNGVLFGAGAQVNVGGLVASTMSMDSMAFMNGGSTFTQGPNATGDVVNQGRLTAANGGYIALLGKTVRNDGTINAPLGTVALGAGSNITLTFSGNSLVHMQVDESVYNTLAENGGLIQADGGVVVMTAGAANSLLASVVNNTGTVEARTIQNHEGTITLLGGMETGTVNVDGTLDASAPNGGNGGAIETSAATVNVADSARIDTRAPQGLMGSWLIDPLDFTVAASGGNITGAALSAELKLANVTLDTVHTTGSAAGDINVNDAVNWSSNSTNASSSTLTLNAANNINVNAPIAWGVSGTPGDATTTGALMLNAGGVVNIGAAMNAFWRAPLTMNTGPASSANPSTVNVDLLPNAGGFAGAVNFYSDAGATAAGGAGLLAINGNNYTVISDVTPGSGVGVAGDTGSDSLQGMQNNLGGYYALGSNIDASATASWNGSTGFSAMANGQGSQFGGVFDGLGHTITGLVVRAAGAYSAGLFGNNDGTVRNVGMVVTNISGGSYSGALVGMNYNGGIVSNSYAIDPSYVINPTTGGMVSGAIISGGSGGGGLVGANKGIIDSSYTNVFMPGGAASGANYTGVGGLAGVNHQIIRNSYAIGPVRSIGNAGGLVGSNYNGTISNSYATGPVWARGGGGGGLVGFNSQHASIDNSYATGDLSGAGKLGGLVGWNDGAISNSYATGYGINTGSAGAIGGLVGINDGPISNSYATGDVNGAGIAPNPSEPASRMNNIGGLVGQNYGTIDGSHATGAVIGYGNFVGGLVGGNVAGSINNSYATGDVTANGSNVGGLVGAANAGLAITNSYALGNVSGSGSVGGLIGQDNGALPINSFYNAQGATINGLTIDTGATYTAGFLYGAQFTDWVTHGMSLDVANYAADLTPVAGGYYTIDSLQGLKDMLGFSGMANGPKFRLAADLDLSSLPGFYFSYFAGTLDGAGHTISDLSISSGLDRAGLFSILSTTAVISNLGLTDVNVSGNNSVGGLAGINLGTISNSYATGSVTGAGNDIGGLVGVNQGAINGSNSAVDVNGAGGDIGGLVGANNGGTIAGSSTNGSVTLTGNNGGGLVGVNSGTITGSNSSASVSSTGSYVGGLVGYNNAGSTIDSSFATGSVRGINDIGGLAGSNDGTIADNSYANATVSGGDNIGGLAGANNGAIDSSSHAGGSLSGNDNIGGLVGSNAGTLDGFDLTVSVNVGSGGSNNVGGLAGLNTGTISNSDVTGSVSGIGTNTGGLVGYNNQGTIINSHATGSVGGSSYVGGLAGFNQGAISHSGAGSAVTLSGNNAGGLVGGNSGTIIASVATGTVFGANADLGGLVGINNTSGAISGSDATGSVTGGTSGTNVGGLVGINDGVIGSENYSTGSVDGSSNIGGLVGYNRHGTLSGFYVTTSVNTSRGSFVGALAGYNDGTIIDSHASGDVSGVGNVGGLIGGNGGTVTDSDASGSVTGSGATVGGLVGYNNGGTINGGSATGSVDGVGNVGGLAGVNQGTIVSSHASGSVNNTDDNAGGLVGANLAAISASYATGSVSGIDNVGGLAGQNVTTAGNGTNGYDGPATDGSWRHLGVNTTSSIDDSYATGVVTGRDNVGGLVGQNSGNGGNGGNGAGDGLEGLAGGVGTAEINNSYATGSVTGRNDVGGLTGQNAGNNGSAGNTIMNGTGPVSGGAAGIGDSSVSDSYAIGSVSASGNSVGSLTGNNIGNVTVADSFYNSDVNPTLTGFGSSSGNLADVAGTVWGMNTAAMQMSANFTGATGTSAVTDHSGNGGINPGWDLIDAGGGSGVTWFMTDGHSTPLLDAALIRLTITADNAGTTYNGGAYTGGDGVTYSVTPDFADLLGALGYSGTSQGAVNAGSYGITPGGLYSAGGQNGYVITYVGGTLTIAPAPITISSGAVTKQYDGTTSVTGGTYVVDGTLYTNSSNGNTTQDSLSGGSYAFASANVLGAGNSTVDVSGMTINDGNGGGNYVVTYVNNTDSTITPAPITVTNTSGPITKQYDGTTAASGGTYSVSGTLYTNADNGNTQQDAVTGATFDYASANVLGAGNSTVSMSGVTINDGNGGNNYAVTVVGESAGSITAAPITVSSAPVSKQYDGTTSVADGAPVVGGTLYANASNGNVQDSVTGGLYAYESPDVLGDGNSTVDVSGVTINDGNGGRNYAVTYLANTASTITPVISVTPPPPPTLPDNPPATPDVDNSAMLSTVSQTAGRMVALVVSSPDQDQGQGQIENQDQDRNQIPAPLPASASSPVSNAGSGVTISLGGNGSSLQIQSDSVNLTDNTSQ
jgi:filamentous hemagglutinin family protein